MFRINPNASSYIPRYIRNAYNSNINIQPNRNGVIYSGNDLDLSNDLNLLSLESLLSISQLSDTNDSKEETRTTKFTLKDFKNKNINKLKENLLYYYASPEILLNFRSDGGEDNFDFYKNLDCENFLSSQKEIIKKILSNSRENEPIKKSKLSNYQNNFCLSLIPRQISDNGILNANLILMKLDEFSCLDRAKDLDMNRIISFLNEFKDIILANIINMESLGFVFFNSVENNLILTLKLIVNKLCEKKDIKILNNFILICVDILKKFNSTKLYFFILKFLKNNKDVLNSFKLDSNETIIQLMPNNSINFKKLEQNINTTK